MSFTSDINSSFEPLLRSGSARSPPRHAFQFRTNAPTPDTATTTALNLGVTTPASHHQPTNVPRTAGPETESHRFFIQHYLGRSYGSNLSLFIAIAIQAVCIALASVLVLGLVSLSQSLWLDLNYSFMPPTKGQFNWIYVTAMGGFMAGLFLLIPGAPSVGGYASYTQMLVYLETRPSESIPVLLASSIVLSCGAPLGPEVALGAVASCLSSFLSRWATDSRARAVMLLTSLAAVLGALFPTGVLIPLVLVHELALTGRPDKLTTDSVIAQEISENELEGRRSGIVLQTDTHDHTEGLTLQLVSVLIVAWISRAIAPTVAPIADFTPTDDRNTEPWHYAAAILIGVVCGIIGLAILTLYSLTCVIRRKACKWLRRRGVPLWVTLLLFTTFAGVFHGLMAVWCPYSSTMGLQFLKATWEAAQNRESVLNASDFCWTAVARSASLAIAVGCGFLGGSVLPMIVIGGCVGFSLGLSIHWLPLSLTVPCCLAACPVSLCPVPLTATLGVALMLGCSMEESTSVLIACLSSWMLTGGLGFVRSIGEWAIGLEGALEDDESVENVSDDEMLRSIRNTIFGDA
jgi:H+/Cl- antiporter ClcA